MTAFRSRRAYASSDYRTFQCGQTHPFGHPRKPVGSAAPFAKQSIHWAVQPDGGTSPEFQNDLDARQRRITSLCIPSEKHGGFFRMSHSSVIRARSRFNCRYSASLLLSPDAGLRELPLPRIQRMCAECGPLRNFRYRISPFRNRHHRIMLELITKIGLPHQRLQSLFLGA